MLHYVWFTDSRLSMSRYDTLFMFACWFGIFSYIMSRHNVKTLCPNTNNEGPNDRCIRQGSSVSHLKSYADALPNSISDAVIRWKWFLLRSLSSATLPSSASQAARQ